MNFYNFVYFLQLTISLKLEILEVKFIHTGWNCYIFILLCVFICMITYMYIYENIICMLSIFSGYNYHEWAKNLLHSRIVYKIMTKLHQEYIEITLTNRLHHRLCGIFVMLDLAVIYVSIY